jgi:eukaryotic-like serine/threonine-protein kinase
MKPSNVLVRSHDGMATVMDFGIAKMTTSTRLTATGQTMGTVRYMSPEQVRGQDVDLRTDLYSLGATLYESLTGDTPFDGSTHFEIMTKHLTEVPKRPSLAGIEVPEAVEDALMRSLAKKPEDRFLDAREMRKILEAALRQGDLGLVETQKLNRQVLDDVRPAAPTPSPTQVATATPASLADELEPGTGMVPTARPRGRKGMWVALAAVLVAGGGVATLVLRPSSDPATTGIRGVTSTGRSVFDGVVVEASGSVTPLDLDAAYRSTLVKLRASAQAEGVTFADPIDEIVAIPRAAFCEPSA